MTITTKFTEHSGSSTRSRRAACSGWAARIRCGRRQRGWAWVYHRADAADARRPGQRDRQARELTDKPFGVNLTILPAINPPPYDVYRQVIVNAGIKIVETAGSNPAPHLPMFHDNGIRVLHKCTSVRHAVKAQSLGVDGISIDDYEVRGPPPGRGHPGPRADPGGGRQDRHPDDRLRRLRRRPWPGGRAGAGRRRHQHGLAIHVHRRIGHPSEREGSDRGGQRARHRDDLPAAAQHGPRRQ